MKKVENGLFVSVDYVGTLENGEIFDTSQGRQALEVQVGAGQVIAGFENALMGMSLNEKKVFTLKPEDAYGQRNEKLVYIIDKKEFPSDMSLQVGMIINLQGPAGHPMPAQVAQMDDKKVTLDLNHPLAGQSLTFEIEVRDISATPTQIPTGCSCSCDCSSGGCHEL